MRAFATVLLLFMLLPAPASAYPMSAWGKDSLKKDFARMRYTTADRVLELRAFDLSRARGVKGFTLGRGRVKGAKWIQGGLVIYFRSGKGYRMWGQGMGLARKVRPVALVDLARKQTVVSTGHHFWGSRTIKEPPGKVRWPVLIVQAESLSGDRLEHETFIISLKTPTKPRLLLRLRTLSRRQGEPKGKGRKFARFAGTRVDGLRFIKRKGAPQLQITEQRISTRYNRCKEPKPTPTLYLLKEGRFVRQPSKPGSSGCY